MTIASGNIASAADVLAAIAAAGTVTASGGTTPIALSARFGRTISPEDFGAVGDGTTDDTAALNAWWSALVSGRAEGHLRGKYKATSALTWNMSTRPAGIVVRGSAQSTSLIDLTSVSSGTPLLITGGGTDLFYGHFSKFTVKTNIAGPGVQLGALGLSDALNTFSVEQIEFKNLANSTSAIALQCNGVFNSDFRAVTTNTGGGLSPAAVGGTSRGVSLQLRRAQFSRFMGSFSGAETGIHLTSDYNFGNVFEAVDVEVVNRCIVIDSANATKNTFIGGTYVGATLFDFTAGGLNVIENPNCGAYSGGAVTAGVTGMFLRRPGVGVSTPSVPATATPVTNTTGRTVWVIVHNDVAGLTQILVGGSTYVVTSGTVILQPGDTITLTYGSGTPSWEWRAIL